MLRSYFVYILASHSRALYIGVTNDPTRRLAEHRADKISYTARYRIHRVAYLEEFSHVDDAIAREKELKAWRREKKLRLIEV